MSVLYVSDWFCVFCQDIEENEGEKKDIQCRVDELVKGNQNSAFLRMINQYRMLVWCCPHYCWLSLFA